MRCWVDISVPGRQGERHRLSEEGTTIGSSSAADIRLQNAPGILGIHCSLRPQPEGCWVELIESAQEPIMVDGRPSRGCLVGWNQDAFLGSIRLTLGSDGPGGRKGPSALVWVAALVVPLLGASFLLRPGAEAGTSRTRVSDPPALFGPLPTCSEEQAGALGRAAVAEQVARAKHERGVFEAKDSVDAVQLMREAAVCYTLGNNQGLSDRALNQAEDWIGELRFSYKRALLDLEVGRRAENPERIIDAVARLSVLLGNAGEEAVPFKAWLAQLRRVQVAEMSQRRKKK